jgi:hypothetical protein
VLGFKAGTGNVRRGRDFDRHVWVTGRERAWMVGGTFLVVRRIDVLVDAWRALSVLAQERVIGRARETGAPLGRDHEFERLPLDAELIPADAHARLAAPASNGGATMLRRGYSYPDGLLFLAFQSDPRRQYVPVQQRLAESDALSRFTRHTGSAVFAIPPGARPGGFIGDGLFERGGLRAATSLRTGAGAGFGRSADAPAPEAWCAISTGSGPHNKVRPRQSCAPRAPRRPAPCALPEPAPCAPCALRPGALPPAQPRAPPHNPLLPLPRSIDYQVNRD